MYIPDAAEKKITAVTFAILWNFKQILTRIFELRICTEFLHVVVIFDKTVQFET